MHWQTTRYRIDLGAPKVMGIVNVTPDSFSDGGSFGSASAAIDHCRRLIDEGADILDIGGESSRPGAAPVPVAEELKRVMPVLEAALEMGCPVSVDTAKAEVMREALRLGIDIVNDIKALGGRGALEAVAEHSTCGVCLMHMRGDPASMQAQARYTDVVEEVAAYLKRRADALQAHGVAAERIVLDPGIGFGKTVAHNFELLQRQPELMRLGYPLLAGWSRKSSIGAVTGRDAHHRLAGSVSAALAAVSLGARIVRVHDVAETVDALKVWTAAGLVPTSPTSDSPTIGG